MARLPWRLWSPAPECPSPRVGPGPPSPALTYLLPDPSCPCGLPAAPALPVSPSRRSGEPAVAMAPLPSLRRDSQLPRTLSTCGVARSLGPCSLCRLSCTWPPPPGRSQKPRDPAAAPCPSRSAPGLPARRTPPGPTRRPRRCGRACRPC